MKFIFGIGLFILAFQAVGSPNLVGFNSFSKEPDAVTSKNITVKTKQRLKPNLFLLSQYKTRKKWQGWVMSEKFDGIRAYWNGKVLLSRRGNIIHAPNWFIAQLPPFSLDGELWTKRHEFEKVSSIVRQKNPDERWHEISYQIFEVPNISGSLFQRLAVLRQYLDKHPVLFLKVIQQNKVVNAEVLTRFYQKVTQKNGEGIVVRDARLPYQTGRLASAMKLKPYEDAECRLLEILPGKGKYRQMVGSFKCQIGENKLGIKPATVIRLGSGLTDQIRQHPPKLGSLITFKFNGLTAYKKPRFPVFLRVRKTAHIMTAP